ncbi:tigger transposable element-derived protein 6-like [Dreissena polymorpha]|uniref:tigger transposable element-derived protein 6-like n=1 Tax=Dreissena polymorpha TaxID=45954 RepID=UPI002263CB05|nr:tigger transposable element-derived protein 6-like [Dreissena polymorpha]
MRRKGCKILLFLDNAASHTANMNLSHVQLSFLPANTMSALQPLDQGVIRAFNFVYRRFMLRVLLTTIEVTDDAASVCRSLMILDAIKWAVKAWQATQASTIQKCFRACGFTAETTETSDNEFPDNNMLLTDLVLHFQFQLDELTSLDTDVEPHYSELEAGNVNCYRENAAATAAAAADSAATADDVDQTQEEKLEVPPVTLKEIRDFVLRLQQYRHETDGDVLATADTLSNSSEIKIVKQKCVLKQRVISDFF